MDNKFLTQALRQQQRLNPDAVPNYKIFSLRLNEWEYERLSTAASETGRTKQSFVRWAIRKQAEQEL